MGIVARADAETQLREALGRAPIVLVTGPRQAGKSTLARQVVNPPRSNFFDLEDPRDAARLGAPTLSLPMLQGTVVIDEAQRNQDLFPVLRVLADEDRRPGRFLILGSASPDLVGLASESLAGRVTLMELGGFELRDLGPDALDALWLRGGLPRSYLAEDAKSSSAWREDYIQTFLERDLANLGIRIPASTMRRFWTMLAHYHGQTWNGAELARALGVSQPTVRRYLDALSDALVVRQLQPWFTNIGKRQVRSPKIYVRDSGLLHSLLGIRDYDDLLAHPKIGASWEGFVIEQLLARGAADPWFWGTQAGAEIDLLVSIADERIGIEIKRTDRPKMTRSMSVALADLSIDRVVVAHAGGDRFPLAERVEAVPVRDLLISGLPIPQTS
ncbi:ATP-binding protein [Glycomyces arizonensis]|uniref:ATP-binding protein n=1 Tax=Glycomyces arizonensis TaxID=256035 RepID=UPI0004208AE2|nr:ATP-binding protein [Glycomyces arizonensis]